MKSDGRAPVRLLIVIPEHEGGSAVERQLGEAASGAFEVVGRAHTESQALARYFQCAPDIVVLDCQVMPAEPARLVGLLKRMAPGFLKTVGLVVPGPDLPFSKNPRTLLFAISSAP